ncbi:MAG: hypothetical protein ABL962_18125 [Fimbriimonadaceae bacterium]
MLLSVEHARLTLSKLWLALSLNNAAMLGVFLFPMFMGQIATDILLGIMVIGAILGIWMGMYLMYRSTFDSSYGLHVFIYVAVILEFMFCVGAAVLVAQIAGRSDLRWLALVTTVVCLLVPLLAGMYLEAKNLGWHIGEDTLVWKSHIEKYIDRSTHEVRTSLTTADFAHSGMGSIVIIAGVVSANIPLLFELFGGGRANAVYFAAPLLLGTFAYVNFTNFGPGFVRLLLLRKLEKAVGRRFVNADLVQIQDLRRSFFLSRWLMKDYAPPRSDAPVHGPLKGQKHRI